MQGFRFLGKKRTRTSFLAVLFPKFEHKDGSRRNAIQGIPLAAATLYPAARPDWRYWCHAPQNRQFGLVEPLVIMLSQQGCGHFQQLAAATRPGNHRRAVDDIENPAVHGKHLRQRGGIDLAPSGFNSSRPLGIFQQENFRHAGCNRKAANQMDILAFWRYADSIWNINQETFRRKAEMRAEFGRRRPTDFIEQIHGAGKLLPCKWSKPPRVISSTSVATEIGSKAVQEPALTG